MSYTDPETGKFKKGNPGKPKGAVSERTMYWDEMKEWVSGEGMNQYNEVLQQIKEEDPKEFAKRYEAILEYFKPKLARTEFEDKTPDKELDLSRLTKKEREQFESFLRKLGASADNTG